MGLGLGFGRIRLAVFVAMRHVLTVGARMAEPFEALLALKRLLARVKPFVLGQMVFVFEGLVAKVAFMRPLTCNYYTVRHCKARRS